jgi:hypothetical protein
MSTEKPLKSVSFAEMQTYAISIALKEAEEAGLLTKETVLRIGDRADELIHALLSGKILETNKSGTAVIRDATADEEEELSDPAEFPVHHAVKTTLDV